MYQYVFASVFYCNIDGNNFKLSVHRNPRLIKSHSVIAPLYQPIKFSSNGFGFGFGHSPVIFVFFVTV